MKQYVAVIHFTCADDVEIKEHEDIEWIIANTQINDLQVEEIEPE